ncbi:MAG: tRNA (adenosine(37)-N6)-threonylcarbamoyltransferase complex ATPase subunit type 1 TsaE [Clostridia bacterium]|nr:tRNA (adenosine(37)-N6)-threonylcarbamoyltransferase complex ATPase subunit type 1 TsaE [Clostridia bacterium]
MNSYISNSIQETKELGKQIASKFNKGDVVVLNGDLGAGKTAFVAGVASYWNKENEVSSPTFTIINEIVLNDDLSLFHFDVYRLEDEDEFYAIGGEEYFDKGITLMEWGNTIKSALPKEYLEIKIDKDSNNENIRIFNFIPHGKHYEELIERI